MFCYFKSIPWLSIETCVTFGILGKRCQEIGPLNSIFHESFLAWSFWNQCLRFYLCKFDFHEFKEFPEHPIFTLRVCYNFGLCVEHQFYFRRSYLTQIKTNCVFLFLFFSRKKRRLRGNNFKNFTFFVKTRKLHK